MTIRIRTPRLVLLCQRVYLLEASKDMVVVAGRGVVPVKAMHLVQLLAAVLETLVRSRFSIERAAVGIVVVHLQLRSVYVFGIEQIMINNITLSHHYNQVNLRIQVYDSIILSFILSKTIPILHKYCLMIALFNRFFINLFLYRLISSIGKGVPHS